MTAPRDDLDDGEGREEFDFRFAFLSSCVVAIGTGLFLGISGRTTWPRAFLLGASGGAAGIAAAAWLSSGALLDLRAVSERYRASPARTLGVVATSAVLLALSWWAEGPMRAVLVAAGCATGVTLLVRRR